MFSALPSVVVRLDGTTDPSARGQRPRVARANPPQAKRRLPAKAASPKASRPQMPGAEKPTPGMSVGGRYRLIAHLGDGGMGTVYRAQDTKSQREVAIKILKPGQSLSFDRVARFKQEARTLARLKHPNSVRVLDAGRCGTGLLYIVMELLGGRSLGEELRQHASLTWQSAFRIAIQVLRALNEAHAKGIIHRDLKPENIFLCGDSDGRHSVKVLDYGLAKSLGDQSIGVVQTQTGFVFGTPRYMAPEQARGLAVDSRADIYNVGLLLYQMVCGSPLFRDADAVVVMAKHARQRPEPPSKRAPHLQLPRFVESIILDALAKEPSQRHPSAAAFAKLLERALKTPERAHHGATWYQRPQLRLPRLALASVLVGCAVLTSAPLVSSAPRTTEREVTVVPTASASDVTVEREVLSTSVAPKPTKVRRQRKVRRARRPTPKPASARTKLAESKAADTKPAAYPTFF